MRRIRSARSSLSAPTILALALAVGACGGDKKTAGEGKDPVDAKAQAADTKPDPERVKLVEEAKAFVSEVDANLRKLWVAASKAEWEKSTNITDETEAKAAEANAAVMAYETEAISKSAKFRPVLDALDPSTRRQIELLQRTATLPAPPDAEKREELARIAAKLEGMYGKGKYCKKQGGKEVCRDLGELSRVLAESRDETELLDAWVGWRTISPPMRPLYQRLVELGNEGAKAIGYRDMGEIWRSRYDMSPEEFEREVERLWKQVEPLYRALHCHVRAKLHEVYGDKVPLDGPIPAHLLGNMWAQDWSNIYPMVEPNPGAARLDITRALEAKGYDPIKMVKAAEGFFVSLGLDPLPKTFWERSMFEKPADREVVCHASAWDVNLSDDLRIKMCIKVDHEDFVTIHHELGHNYYYHYYYRLPVLFQAGAHDGFHEAIGDAIALSITPEYLEKIGLIEGVKVDEAGILNKQMQDALQKIAFLPFGKLVDGWRWRVFAGDIGPDAYNAGWWKLRTEVQGVAAPVPRTEEHFDPGAKYHIPANVPYMRYFLAHILQFQFHKALCEAAGHQGPLHTCSIYGSKEAGAKLRAMLELGASRPWPDALEKLTGTRKMDAAPLVEYFAPLAAWLEEQNQGRTCGW
ncbi:MAG: peptidase M2 family protein [Deltaproteobacteria bacterium]|nr:MAG: peptidase M2 family protein [Deltaproteobacteria bacterium]